MDEFLPLERQKKLEYEQREEEDKMYRLFLQERRDLESKLQDMNEEERDGAFLELNNKERSRMMNLNDKHCTQMMDLIHR